MYHAILYTYIVNHCRVQTWILKIRLGEGRTGKQSGEKKEKEQKKGERAKEKESIESIKVKRKGAARR